MKIFGSENPFRSHIKFFRCYIDDLIFICYSELGTLDNFLLYLNDNSLNRSFTGQMDRCSIDFLVVTLEGCEGRGTQVIPHIPLKAFL